MGYFDSVKLRNSASKSDMKAQAQASDSRVIEDAVHGRSQWFSCICTINLPSDHSTVHFNDYLCNFIDTYALT
jgi:hypothetical protein